MSRRTTALFKAGLSALHYTGLDSALSRWSRGAGAVLMLHQVTAQPPPAFSPNRILQVTPHFLDATIRQVREAGFDIVSMDEVARRLEAPGGRPFVAFTLDDAYRDNLLEAYPVFRKRNVPFTIYAPTDYLDGRGELWWIALERVIAGTQTLTTQIGGISESHATRTVGEKSLAFHRIYWRLRAIDETFARAEVRRLCEMHGIDSADLCRELIMTWAELKSMADDPLVTIGAHTCRHFAVARLPEATARREMADSKRRIEHELGRSCRHFSFPFGDEASAGPRDFALAREVGFETAVTTRKGVVRLDRPTSATAIPRVSLNGDYQDARYVKVLLSGVPFAMRDAARFVLRRHAPV
jgi:peptidoglycan/xylan/chitin deacetylase (PgdA/CDA1 family)